MICYHSFKILAKLWGSTEKQSEKREEFCHEGELFLRLTQAWFSLLLITRCYIFILFQILACTTVISLAAFSCLLPFSLGQVIFSLLYSARIVFH